MEAHPTRRDRKPSQVALFATCVADLTVPGPAAAAVELLEACGCR
jgi:Fe-S oxidoreductase